MARQAPAPGPVLGLYPERIDPPLPSALHAASQAWLDGTPLIRSWRMWCLRRWCADVRHALDVMPAPNAPGFEACLHHARAELAQGGLGSVPAIAATALALRAIAHHTGKHLRDSQIMAARIVLDGGLVEMPTGSGKSLATALAAAVAGLAGVPVHVLSSNDYLARRDCQTMGAVFGALGLSSGAIEPQLKREERRKVYACDIAYASAKELTFDWLRDQLLPPPLPGSDTRRVLRGLCMAIVDEADSVLIDEAATPLILSESYSEAEQLQMCRLALGIAGALREGRHFSVDAGAQRVRLSDEGRALVASHSSPAESPLWNVPRYRDELVSLALTATHVLRRDVHYIVHDKRVRLIDAASGRVAEGRSWSRGLQQMVELRERCEISPATRTIAQTTCATLFPRYHLLGGLSGTLSEARGELLAAYGLRVMELASEHPSLLRIAPPRVFSKATTRLMAVLGAIERAHAEGRPVLVGTDSVEESERVARLLTARGLPHQVLNARQDQQEAEFVARAGSRGHITVATNMAGRGTDILLDSASLRAGGLHVICCQHNASRRIDRQLLGRAARHGQPGSAEILLSLEEGLLSRHLSHFVRGLLSKAFNSRRPMPLVIARGLTRLVQRKEERRLSQARRLLREQDKQAQRKALPGLGS